MEITMLLLCILGSYYLLHTHIFGLVFCSTFINLFVLSMATTGHPLMQSLVLTAIVISTGTLALWHRQSE